MKCVHTFRTGRRKRQVDITLLFQYIFYTDHWCKIRVLSFYRGGNGYLSNGKRLSFSDLHGIWTLDQNKGCPEK